MSELDEAAELLRRAGLELIGAARTALDAADVLIRSEQVSAPLLEALGRLDGERLTELLGSALELATWIEALPDLIDPASLAAVARRVMDPPGGADDEPAWQSVPLLDDETLDDETLDGDEGMTRIVVTDEAGRAGPQEERRG